MQKRSLPPEDHSGLRLFGDYPPRSPMRASAADAGGSPTESGLHTRGKVLFSIESQMSKHLPVAAEFSGRQLGVSPAGWLDSSHDERALECVQDIRIEIPNYERIGTPSPAPSKTLASKFVALLDDSSISRTFS